MTTPRLAYVTYLASPRWRLLRWLRRKVDGGRCVLCNSSVQLQTHHRSYKHKGGNLIGELRDIVTLCKAHHAAYHADD